MLGITDTVEPISSVTQTGMSRRLHAQVMDALWHRKDRSLRVTGIEPMDDRASHRRQKRLLELEHHDRFAGALVVRCGQIECPQSSSMKRGDLYHCHSPAKPGPIFAARFVDARQVSSARLDRFFRGHG